MTPCSRCGTPCKISTRKSNPDARLLKLAKDPKDIMAGMCVNCAFTVFVKGIETLMVGINQNGPATVFGNPMVQQGFCELFEIGKADACFKEVDFGIVIENWNLP